MSICHNCKLCTTKPPSSQLMFLEYLPPVYVKHNYHFNEKRTIIITSTTIEWIVLFYKLSQTFRMLFPVNDDVFMFQWFKNMVRNICIVINENKIALYKKRWAQTKTSKTEQKTIVILCYYIVLKQPAMSGNGALNKNRKCNKKHIIYQSVTCK